MLHDSIASYIAAAYLAVWPGRHTVQPSLR